MPLSDDLEPIKLKSRRTNVDRSASDRIDPLKPYQPISVGIFDMKNTSLIFETKQPHKIKLD